MRHHERIKTMEIIIPAKVHAKIMEWVMSTDLEVSGFCKVSWNKETNQFTLRNAHLLDIGGKVSTEVNAQDVAALMRRTRPDPGELKLWWHSHPNLSVNWSSTDVSTIEQMGAHGWIAATVFNNKGEYRSAICCKSESIFGSGTHFYDDIKTTILQPRFKEREQWKKEFAEVQEKVRKRQAERQEKWASVPLKSEDSFLKDTTLTNTWGDTNPTNPWSDDMPTNTWSDDTPYEGGWTGYGLEKEAHLLKMSKQAYLKILDGGSQEDLDKIDHALSTLLPNYYPQPDNI